MPTKIELAAQFVNSTSSHIFLTGKAGTGKTTFLHNLANATHKNFVIVAPTGIAALNAKGVTIHSQFLLPFGTFLPGTASFNGDPGGNFYTSRELARRNPLNSARKQVLRNIDLLIIDEVSMLRADLLDAIDYRLKSVKGNFHQSFGGVQLLMIGDLFQLPPIVKDHEWSHLQQFYNSVHFFESQALKQDGFTYIELDKIFRQQDDKFIRILNNLRNDQCTAQDIEELNRHYSTDPADEDVVTITTHNYRADKMNRDALDKLPGESHYFEAVVDGDFAEHLFPLPESLELKVGAQVMFIKNDTEGNRFFNGKIAKVKSFSDDGICVEMDDDDEFWLERHVWKNRKYKVDSKTQELAEETIGTFTQYPIKLAWAITVHKSQGLTFEKAVIDVGKAFAPGQVYVALSRLRSLDGLVLRTPISESVISSDGEVVKFSSDKNKDDELSVRLKAEQNRFLHELLSRAFDFEDVIKQIDYIQKKAGAKMDFEDEEMRNALSLLREKFLSERSNTSKFRNQIKFLLHENDHQKLKQRVQKGSAYYQRFLSDRLLELLIHHEEVNQLARTKTYRNLLDELDQLISKKMEEVQKSVYLSECIIEGKDIEQQKDLRDKRKAERKNLMEEAQRHVELHPKNLSTKSGRKKKGKQQKKGATYQETYSLLRAGLTPVEIAKKRGLVEGTIESHIARGISERELSINQIIEAAEIKDLEKAFGKNPNQSITEVYKNLNGKFSYGKLRMMQAHLKTAED